MFESDKKICWTPCTPTGNVSRRSQQLKAPGEWTSAFLVLSVKHSRTVCCMQRFPVYCLRSIVHLRHETLTMTMIPWPGAGWLCRAIPEILQISRAWLLVRVKDVPLQSKVFSTFFSVWKDSCFILMPRDAFTHIYTIKCWRWCCVPSRNLGFLPFLARGQPCRFTALQQEHTKRC